MASRKSTDDRLTTLRQRQERLQAQMAALETRKRAEQRRRETRRAFVVGSAVLAHAETDPAFRDMLGRALSSTVTREADRAIIADLLGPMPSS